MTDRPSLQQRLIARRVLVGLLQTHPNPPLAEMAGMCGYDFVLLDGEHGLFDEMDFLRALQALAAVNVAAIVRVAGSNTQAVGRYLDMGVDGLVIPNVSTADQARMLVRAMEYPPKGTRGLGAALHRSTRYGLDLSKHMAAPRADACMLALIESASAVAKVEDILAVEGLDGVIIGPSDLSADLGCAGDFSQPAYVQAVTRIERAAVACGKLLGTAPCPDNPLEALVARGHRFFIIGADMPLICEAMAAQVAAAKARI